MTVSKSALTFSLTLLVATSLSASFSTSSAQAAGELTAEASHEATWDDLWIGKAKPTKGDDHLPDGLIASQFDLSDDDTNRLPEELVADTLGDTPSELYEVTATNEGSRDPASVKRAPAKRSKQAAKTSKSARSAKSGLQKVTLSKKPAPSRLAQQESGSTSSASIADSKSQWPSTASDGFEFRVRNKSQLSSMWVMKREGRYDVVFATNGGSRVNVTIPPDQFYALTNAASEIRSPASDTGKCRDSFVQVNVVSSGNHGRAVASCLSAKGKDAEKLRMLGAALSGYVR